jgi:hypothetical protein
MDELETNSCQLSDNKSWKTDNFEKVGTKFKCKTCYKQFSGKSGHSTLKYHYESHVHQFRANLPKITTFFPTNQTPKKSFNKRLMDFVVSGQHPLSIVSEPKFIDLIHSLDPKVKIMCSNSLKQKFIKLCKVWRFNN